MTNSINQGSFPQKTVFLIRSFVRLSLACIPILFLANARAQNFGELFNMTSGSGKTAYSNTNVAMENNSSNDIMVVLDRKNNQSIFCFIKGDNSQKYYMHSAAHLPLAGYADDQIWRIRVFVQNGKSDARTKYPHLYEITPSTSEDRLQSTYSEYVRVAITKTIDVSPNTMEVVPIQNEKNKTLGFVAWHMVYQKDGKLRLCVRKDSYDGKGDRCVTL